MSDITNPASPSDQSTEEEPVSRTPSTEETDCNEDEKSPDAPPNRSDSEEALEWLKDHLARLKMIEPDTTCLWPEKVFILLERDLKRVLALRDGKVCLVDQKSMSNSSRDLSCHWHCSENSDHWWGLRNVVSGMFLGEMYPEKTPFMSTNMLVASSPHFTDSNRIHPRQHPERGYELFFIHGKQLVSINVREFGSTGWPLVVGGKGTRGRWEFIEV